VRSTTSMRTIACRRRGCPGRRRAARPLLGRAHLLGARPRGPPLALRPADRPALLSSTWWSDSKGRRRWTTGSWTRSSYTSTSGTRAPPAARSRSLATVDRRSRPGVMRAWLAAALICLGERLAQPQERRV
jgi:hypothetical protein